METIKEIKHRVNLKIKEMKSSVNFNDPVYKALSNDAIGDFIFDSHLIMIPYELVGKNNINEDQYKSHDVILKEWEKHHFGYWNDKLKLIEEYQEPVVDYTTPQEVFHKLSKLIIKIERRALLLRPDPQTVIQVHTRLSGDKKHYEFVRSYWVNENGEKKRMIARNVTDRYSNLDKEIADLFYHRGYAVHRNYNNTHNIVIELGGVKTVVDINKLKESNGIIHFNELFLFDELCKRFNNDYPYLE